MTSRILCCVAAAGLALSARASDPLEMVTGQVQAVGTPETRRGAQDLFERARRNYALRTARQGYKLEITFAVNSGGQTQYDGVWKMEDTFDPKQGLRWTAHNGDAYARTEISARGQLYAEGTPGNIPLRLHEARAALFASLPSSANLERSTIRTSTATLRSTELTCVLLSIPGATVDDVPGRRSDETEECVDPQSGLLMVTSQVPGRSITYDYSNAPRLAGHILPSRIIVTEGGKTVSQISIDRVETLSSADPSLFIPTQEMLERGRAISMAGAQKISRVVPTDAARTTDATAHEVCVFGLVTTAGDLVEAHSLQPSDPYSAAAVDAAQHMRFDRPALSISLAGPPQQHFAFIIEKFVPKQ